MEKKDLIAKLNEDLELELQSVVQYVIHIATIKGAKYQQTLNELDSHLKQELQHALTLAQQIDFLGGVPSNRVPAFERGKDPESALKQDLALEEKQLERYRERVEQASQLQLPDVAEALAPLLQQTQDHIRDLRTALG